MLVVVVCPKASLRLPWWRVMVGEEQTPNLIHLTSRSCRAATYSNVRECVSWEVSAHRCQERSAPFFPRDRHYPQRLILSFGSSHRYPRR